MKLFAHLHRKLPWINLPGAILMMVLQRTPAVSVAVRAGEVIIASPVGTVLKAAVAAVAALGAVNTMVGATPLVPSTGSATGITVAAGSSVSVIFTINGTQTPIKSWSVSGSIPPGSNFSGLTGGGGFVDAGTLHLAGTPTTGGVYNVTIEAFDGLSGGGFSSALYSYAVTVTGNTNVAPQITTQPVSQTVTAGNSVTFTAAASGTPTPTFQWKKDNVAVNGATSSTFTIQSTTANDAGTYTVVATNASG